MTSKDVAEGTRWSEHRWVRLIRSGGGRPVGVLLLLLLVVALVAPRFPLFRFVRLASFDTYQTVAPRQRISAPAVIVAIDDPSLTVLAETRRFEEITREGNRLEVSSAYDGMEIVL